MSLYFERVIKITFMKK